MQQNNEIWYTASEMVVPYNVDAFGANIVSNNWNETTRKGIISFDNDVTSIGDYAFNDCRSLTSITIPDSVTSIGFCAFDDCKDLTSINIPREVASIGMWAFRGCCGVVSINSKIIESDLDDNIFLRGIMHWLSGSHFDKVIIGENVNRIGKYLFENYSSLASVEIADSVTAIGNQAFCMCENLSNFKGRLAAKDGRCLIVDNILTSFAPSGITEYTIPNGITLIGPYAFARCSTLASITIPDSVTSIGERAFHGCSSLVSVIIPDRAIIVGNGNEDFKQLLLSHIEEEGFNTYVEDDGYYSYGPGNYKEQMLDAFDGDSDAYWNID